MTIESLMALALAVFVFSLKPGPGIMTCVSHTMSNGWLGLIAFTSGFNVGLAIYLALVFIGLLGIGHFDIDVLFISILVKSLAAIYLIYLGFKELQKWKEVGQTPELVTDKVKSFFDIALSAMVLTISNPMVIVFYATIISVFINPEALTIELSLVVAFMLMVIDSFGMMVYCLPVLLFRKALPQSFMRYIKLISAIIFILIGLYIGYTAVPASDIMSVF